MEYSPQGYMKGNVFTDFKEAQGMQNNLSGALVKLSYKPPLASYVGFFTLLHSILDFTHCVNRQSYFQLPAWWDLFSPVCLKLQDNENIFIIF